MSQRINYKGKIINSQPLPLKNKDFSSNGIIEINADNKIGHHKPPSGQAQIFQTEDEADEYYIQEAKKLIDEGKY